APAEAPAPAEAAPATLRVPGPVARIARAEGAGVPPPSLRPGRALERGAMVATGPASVVLDFTRGGRVTLGPESVARVDGPEPMRLVLARGSAHAQLPPQGNSARPPLRVGTAAGTLVIEGAGEAYVLALPDGRGWVAQLAGLGLARTGAAGDDERPATVRLPAGRALTFGADAPVAGPANLGAAQQAGAALLEEGPNPPVAARVAASRAADRRLDDLLENLERMETEGARLARMQQALLDEGRAEQARSLRPVLVRHSQTFGRLRERLRVASERALAAHVLAARSQDAERTRRVAVALGREDGGLSAYEAPSAAPQEAPSAAPQEAPSHEAPSEHGARLEVEVEERGAGHAEALPR
ncbi:MAG: hypothetical protein AAGH15_09800, partial [Myxococcota bacterium]